MTDVRDPDLIRHEIEETRQRLGEAVEELAAKTNVKARAREKLNELRHSAAKLPHWTRDHPTAVVAAVAATVLTVVVALRRS